MGIEAPDYNVNVGVSAGFVKNDVAGNFSFGELGGAMQLLETIDVTVATTSLTFSGLLGNTDKRYRLVWRVRKDTAPTAPIVRVFIRPNGFTALQRTVIVNHTTSGATFITTRNALPIAISGGVTDPGETFGETLIDAEARGGTSLGRFFNTRATHSFPTFGGSMSIRIFGGVWNQNSIELTSLEIVADAPLAIGPGSSFSLYKMSV